jgi:hypothetical protein
MFYGRTAAFISHKPPIISQVSHWPWKLAGMPSGQQGQQHQILLPSLPPKTGRSSVHCTCISHSTRWDHGRTRSTKWRSTKPIPACLNATINNNASLKNEKSGTNAKPDATLEQQKQTRTALGKLGHMVTLHTLFNTSAPRGVLVLCGLSCQPSGWSTSTSQFSKTCLKKSIWAIGFRFVPLDSPMFVVSVTVFSCLQAMLVRMLGSRERMLAQQTVLTLDSMHAFVLSQLTQPSDAVNYYAPLLACKSKVSKRSD